MEATEMLTRLLDSSRDMVEKALEGLTDEELANRPND
jgi:hypothetical protein